MKIHIAAGTAAWLSLMLGPAGAQTIINNGANSTTNVFVQRPAVVVERKPTAPAVLPPPPRPSPSSFPYQQKDLLPYMTPRCAQLYEAQLAGGQRRTAYSVRRDLNEEFRLTCQDALSGAQKALYEDRLKTHDQRQQATHSGRLASERSRLDREQCDELLRILAMKRKRLAALSEGETADHERAEANYKIRCAGG